MSSAEAQAGGQERDSGGFVSAEARAEKTEELIWAGFGRIRVRRGAAEKTEELIWACFGRIRVRRGAAESGWED